MYFRFGQFNQENPWEVIANNESTESNLLLRETSAEIVDCLIRCATLAFICPTSLYDQRWRTDINGKKKAPPQRPSTQLRRLELPRAAVLTDGELSSLDKLMSTNPVGIYLLTEYCKP